MDLRKVYKKERSKHEHGSDSYFMYDLYQLISKLLLNTLYGVMGYPGFTLYNRFIAESITTQGKQIICTAINAFENFLADSVQHNTTSELYEYMNNIIRECKKEYADLDVSQFIMDNIDDKLYNRLVKKCAFTVNNATTRIIYSMISNMSNVEKVVLYYKNNLEEFNLHPIISAKFKRIFDEMDPLHEGVIYKIKNEDLVKEINDIWELYKIFTFYNYPIFDRVRKAMYVDRGIVVYGDTDSNFVGMSDTVNYFRNIIGDNGKPRQENDLNIINVVVIFMSRMISATLFTMAKYMNVIDDYAKKVDMKNEVYMDRVVFAEAKKRYISNMIIKEGELLNNGIGKVDIKGYDFIKAHTKPFLKKYYTDLCEKDILQSETIDVKDIYRKVVSLRKDIENSMKAGESKYFKQASVKLPEHYKKPYSTQGITAVTLWNTLTPQYAIELPGDVDIIPIKDLSLPKPPKNKSNPDGSVKMVESTMHRNKNILWLKENHPEAFALLEKNIYNHENPIIRHMSLTSIAKPKNDDVELPEWFEDIIDTEKIVVDTMGLFLPILKSLGLKTVKTTSNVVYPTNMVDL